MFHRFRSIRTGLADTAARRAAAALTAGVMAVSLASCGSGAPAGAQASGDTIAVVASISQWGSLARDLGGDRVTVTSIMTSTNVEAHDYEPTAQDVAAFADAAVSVVNGAGYDAWASKAAEPTGAVVVDAAASGGVQKGDNPHVWFSSSVRSATADAITEAYQQVDPSHAKDYVALNTQWHERERDLEQHIAEASSTTADLPYAATESVAWYLADDLGMHDMTPEGYASAAANDSEPTPADIKAFQDALASGSIKMLVVNTQEAGDTTKQLVDAASASSVPTVELSEQMPQHYDDLIDWMTALVDQFAAA